MRLRLAVPLSFVLAVSGSAYADLTPRGITGSDWSQIRAEYERFQHSVFPAGQGDGWQARNRGQQWLARFDGRGFAVRPDRGGWSWGLELKGYGFEGAERRIRGKARVSVARERAAYDWGAGLEEWFVNSGGGLEHGYTLARRPEGGSGPLRLRVGVRGELRPRIAGGTAVRFVDERGGVAVTYSGLKVTDAGGRVLAARFTVDGGDLRLEVEERGARYPVTIDPLAQQAYLKPAVVGTSQAGDQFGSSVAISGDTVVVGAPFEDSSTTGVNSTPDELSGNSGAAYVFTRTAGVWSQQAYLKPAAVGTTQAGDQFGYSVAISGDTVVVGAYSENSSTTGVNSTPDELAVNAGAAYVFTRTAGVWSQQAYLKPAAVGTTQAQDHFGASVAIGEDTVVVGAYAENSSTTGVNSTPDESAGDAGAAYVFTRTSGVWTQEAYLKPAAVGTTQAGDWFGFSVAISGDTIVAGAYLEDSSTTGVNGAPNESADAAGAAYVFTRTAGVWSQQAYLKPAAVGTTQAQDQFGRSVAISGDTVVVGAYGEDSSTTGVNSTPDESASLAGAAYVFTRTSGVWSQQAYLKPAAVGATQAGDAFGYSVAISGDTVAIGAFFEDSSTTGVNSTPDESAVSAGAAYVFTRTSGVWNQQAYLKPAAVGTTQAVDEFGSSVAVSGDTVVVGAFLEDSSTTGVNSTPDESASNAGAAYVFDLAPPQILTTLNKTAGDNQNAEAGQAFPVALQVKVLDQSANPIAGANVTFTVIPGAGGSSGAFAPAPAQPVATLADGTAAAPVLTANATTGPFTVTATVDGLSQTFTLTIVQPQLPVPPACPASPIVCAAPPDPVPFASVASACELFPCVIPAAVPMAPVVPACPSCK